LIVPLDSGVLLALSTTVARYVPNNGTYANDKSWTLPAGASPTVAALTGDELLVFSADVLLGSFGSDPMLVPLSQPQQQPQKSLGFGPEGIWVVDADGTTLDLYQPGQHAPVASAQPPFPDSWQSNGTQYGDVPSTSGAFSLFASFDSAAGITFANWGPLALETVVTHSWAVFQQTNMDVVVKKRPSP
jgi:hypothetical protein